MKANLQDLYAQFFASRFLSVGWVILSFCALLSRIPHQFADLGPISDASVEISSGNNPYLTNLHIGMGPLALKFIGSILTYLPVAYIPIFWQILNLLGFGVFLFAVAPKTNFQQKATLFTLIIWLAPLRETLINNQINGIALGMVGLARISRLQAFRNYRAINTFMFFFASILAIELKINITIIFLLVNLREISRTNYLAMLKYLIVPFSFSIYYILSNIEFYRSWVVRLWGFSKTDPFGNETSSIYLGFSQFSKTPIHGITVLGFGLIVLLGLFFQRQLGQWVPILIAAIFPSVLSYVHFLDLSAAAILLVLYSLTRGSSSFSYIILIALVPTDFLKLSNMMFLVVFLTVSIVVRKAVFSKSTEKVPVIIGIVLYSISTTLVSLTSDSNKNRISIVMLQLVILTCLTIGTELKAKR